MNIHEIPEIDQRGLRQFGLTTAAIVSALFGFLFPWLFDRHIPSWPWIIAGVLALWAISAPDSMRGLYRGWMIFGLFMGRIMTPIILGIVFFLLLAPMGLIMRMIGRDTMSRQFDSAISTYRVTSVKYKRDTVERPF